LIRRTRLYSVVLALVLGACTPAIEAPGPAVTTPKLTTDVIVTSDGANLPLRSWPSEGGAPRAIILALHGFNDYSNFFDDPGLFLAQKYQITSYAYDQRGFGQAPHRGLWAGVDAYADDAKNAIKLLKEKHPGIPIYLLGESMGGAVTMVALTSVNPPSVDGAILAAPAVWGRITMPWYQRLALWIGANTVPSMTVTGEGLNIVPSDNIEMLIELGRDPLVIKKTRIGTIYGLVNLMDAGLESAPKLYAPALILYGQRDEIIPKKPTALMIEKFPKTSQKTQRIALYEGGYHMLLRDLPAATVWKDIAAWIKDPSAPLPSKADLRDLSILTNED
jgi:acylglycerol lipase